ncbi:MAG: hypothetical protein KGJ18_03535 [Gammaproteobacteria bacterium]|nr:hypothetical protein [Gammaproteobacteria bacterium]
MLLTVISLSSLAANRRTQFVVMVRVLPRCQWSLEPDKASSGQFAIECTRNTGYSISLVHGSDSRLQTHRYTVSGVGSGTRKVIPLQVPTTTSMDAVRTSSAPLFLTISY